MSDTLQIYVACLAAYNAGKLHGRWIEVTDVDTMQEQIDALLKASPEPGAEEWAVHDYEGFYKLNLGEHPDLDDLVSIAEFIEEKGEIAAEFIAHECLESDPGKASERFDEKYQGEHDSLEAYAEDFLDNTGALANLPADLRSYFDFERYGRDLELGGDVYTIEIGSRVHVFDNH